jgi:hypothetical protein
MTGIPVLTIGYPSSCAISRTMFNAGGNVQCRHLPGVGVHARAPCPALYIVANARRINIPNWVYELSTEELLVPCRSLGRRTTHRTT